LPSPTHTTLIAADPRGLRCELGGFHVDPWRAVPLAVVTHAHADHATNGCDRYIASPRTCALLRSRLGPNIAVEPLPFDQTLTLGSTRISLHPAGHVLGSAQVRIQSLIDDHICCVSGDYKITPHTITPDSSCEPFELVPCDTFITESTFALPVFRWPDPQSVADEINAWRADNAANGRTSVLLGYSLGKAQRILSILDPSLGLIGVHGAIHKLNAVYTELGISLPHTVHATKDNAAELKGATIVAPPSVAGAGGTTWLRQFAGPEGLRTAMVSGWMTIRGRRRWRSHDAGFVISDHADWQGLIDTIKATGATRIGVTHGYAEPFARYLREHCSLDSFVVPTRYTGEDGAEEAAAGPEPTKLSQIPELDPELSDRSPSDGEEA
jgi:putative mRNA 3-end processing factor